MALPHILYPPPTKGGWQEWLYQHFTQHKDIIGAVQQTRGLSLTLGRIWPIDPSDKAQLEVFLEDHQQMHNEMNALLGVQGNDLSDVDFQNKKEADVFYWFNYQEHLAASINVGVSI